MGDYILKGNIIYSNTKENLTLIRDGYVVCEGQLCRGAYSRFPDQYQDFELIDYGDCLIIPGMTDLHVHAPQYTVC